VARAPERCRYGTFTLHGDAQGVVHLQGNLPEVVAIGYDPMLSFFRNEPPLGGPHAEIRKHNTEPVQLHITTPEAEFTYTHLDTKTDEQGVYFLMRLTYSSASYHAYLAGL
jgi:hypothetical protein